MSIPSPSKPQFRQTALGSSLISQKELDQAVDLLREAGRSTNPADVKDDQALAAMLIDLGFLNRWQADQLLSGRVKWNLGPYRILDQIGLGGMGQVFKAEHSIMRRIVAIKVLPLHKSTPTAVERFRREIQAQALLDHPNLVRAYDAGQDGNVHFLVTEFVPGMDLRQLIKSSGALGMPAAAALICQAASGLEHAHSRNLIHRDVKPGNLLVTPEGVCKVSDLGLAGFLHDGVAQGHPHKTVGTADYLSPEQVMTPDRLTPVCDIYALGCTLYYAVTARVPFPGGTVKEKARRHCHEQPVDPRRINPELDAAFIEVVADMMVKDPKQRIASAAEVIPRLRPWAGDDWPPTVISGSTQFGALPLDGSAAPPPLPLVVRPLEIPEGGNRSDNQEQLSQGTFSSSSEETLPLDSRGGVAPPAENISRAVVIVIWLAVAAAMAVFGTILYQVVF